ncbi:hypothetical protein [Phocaeicola coprocola]|jgi:hypothetical protein|nr:hypothetical protein [Phocaeicola coprocola]
MDKMYLHNKDIERIEEEIVLLYETSSSYDSEAGRILLSLRKDMINDRVLKRQEDILPDIIAFNDALRDALHTMYDRAHQIWDNLKLIVNAGEEPELTAKCFLDKEFSLTDKVDEARREILWNAICDSDWNILYEEGITLTPLTLPRDLDMSFDTLIGMDCLPPNWNEGLDRELTKDLHLTSAFHHLFRHTDFAITDFITVQKFRTEIEININSHQQ